MFPMRLTCAGLCRRKIPPVKACAPPKCTSWRLSTGEIACVLIFKPLPPSLSDSLPSLSILPNLLKRVIAEQYDPLLVDNLTCFRSDHEIKIRLAKLLAIGFDGE